MKNLHFDYYMRIEYSEPASMCRFSIKCIPQDSMRQQIRNLKIELCPDVPYETNRDGFGNVQIYGNVDQPHDLFYFRVTGEARTGLTRDEAENAKTPVSEICETSAKDSDAMRFRYPYGLNKPKDALRAYFDRIRPNAKMSAYEQGVMLMHQLYQDFTYEKEVTNVKTTAEEAWILGRGVCQDYAHIMIALCHLAGIPARYVTGMLTGEGYSHAWVEVLSDGKWYGLDPTNDLLVTDSHIRIGIGRDAADCLINRGVMLGGGSQNQEICVSVEEGDS